MANILLLDDSEVASRALQGILARGDHRCVVATNVQDAWKLLHELLLIDLVFAELKLPGENGLHFIQRVRLDPLTKQVPIVAYTAVNHHDVIKKTLSVGVQNYLIKPYSDEAIGQEIAKALANPWRNLHFEEEKSFCKLTGLKPEELAGMRENLRHSLEESIPFFSDCPEVQDRVQTQIKLNGLIEPAETAGVWAVVEYLQYLLAMAESGNWEPFKMAKEQLAYASNLIHCHLHPDYIPDGLMSDQDRRAKEESEERSRWEFADVSRGPVVEASLVAQQVETLLACPAMDNVAAAFLMASDTKTTHLTHLMDLVSKDPSLSAQVLIAANKLERDDMNSLEDPRTAVGLLGNLRLSALAKSLPSIPDRHMRCPPITWAQFWMFLVGVGRLAQYSCTALEFKDIEPNAYTAGLLHDLGKLLLVKLYPFGFPTIVQYADMAGISLQEAEKKFIGCTTQEIGGNFAQAHGLPAVYTNVIRYVNTPAEAPGDRDMVAVVSLARQICLHNHVGYCGDTPKDACPPIEETAAWQVIRERVFPSFNLRAFEAQAHEFCVALKNELSGHARV